MYTVSYRNKESSLINNTANGTETYRDMTTTIKHLIDQSLETESIEDVDHCLSTVTSLLSKDPGLTEKFINFYVMKNDNNGYVTRGLQVARRLCVEGNFNYAFLLNIAKDDRFHVNYRDSAIRSAALLLGQIDETIYLSLLDINNDDLRITAVDAAMTNLSTLTDRKKAFRIIKSLLRATKRSEPENLNMMLGAFIDSFEPNEDVFSSLIKGDLEPHEAVIISASFLKETWPDKHIYRKIAEDNSKKSPLAKAYLERYLKLI